MDIRIINFSSRNSDTSLLLKQSSILEKNPKTTKRYATQRSIPDNIETVVYQLFLS